jgi:hypothetical protein
LLGTGGNALLAGRLVVVVGVVVVVVVVVERPGFGSTT